ncbi:MAG: cyclic nucleotide-binding domain-containing protein [Oligoflexia bacterium]|nr:cyclic nucleotide-binding domain-containing protein [Oligoflexia bacterium]
MAYQEILKNIYLFKEFTLSELEPIQELCKLVTLAKGETLFFQGDLAKSLYIIKFGSVHITQKSQKGQDAVEVSMIATGSHFGEMPLLDGEKRSATVQAAEKCELIEIGYDHLKKYLESSPTTSAKFYRNLATFLAGRLRITTLDLSFAREKNLHHF